MKLKVSSKAYSPLFRPSNSSIQENMQRSKRGRKRRRRCRPDDEIPENAIDKFNFARVCKTFLTYREQSHQLLNKKIRFVENLSANQREKLANYVEHLNSVSSLLDHNAQFIESVIEDIEHLFQEQHGYDSYLQKYLDDIKPLDLEPMTMILKQLTREWSKEGKRERISSFTPIIDEIKRKFNASDVDISKVKILFPGAGLCRLPYEVACFGYNCEGNDYSLFMSFVANYILNSTKKKTPSECCAIIYPFLHAPDNVKFNCDQLFPILVPDIEPGSKVNISMSCGDFAEIYSKISEEYECVVTSYFIDCPPNALEIIEIIHQILKAGGVWINNGPLRYHFNDGQADVSIQLSREDLKNVIKDTGFYFEKEHELTSAYFDCFRSMSQSHYQNWYFVCIKTDGHSPDHV